jgi:type IV fimbrial biogenesis protein FimT
MLDYQKRRDLLMRTHSAAGMTIVELLIGLVLIGFLLSLGVPSFSGWLQNLQVRNAAETIFNGLQLARANAVQRNKSVTFTMNGPDSSWAVTIDTPATATVANVLETATVQSRSGAEGTANAQVSVVLVDNTVVPLPFTVSFDGLGRTNLAQLEMIQVTNPTGGTCVAVGGNMRCLNVTVAVGGQIKMCDPQVSAAGDSRKC